jgi:thiamine-monophosphate kinase
MANDLKTESGEDRLIARHFRPLARDPGAFGLVDDAAVLTPPPGSDVVLKADAIVAGVHFFTDDPPGDIARKALRVNLSDLAAKGSKPAGFLLSLALNADVDDDWIAAFAQGLGEDIDTYGCPLFGGDTDRTPGPTMISIAAFGLLPCGTMVQRAGARPGDQIVVTGTIGDSALGLIQRREPERASQWALSDDQRKHLADRYRLPRPRNALAEALRRHAHAAMDISDGLVGDLGKLCRASGVRGEIAVADVPLSAAAATAVKSDSALMETALTGGDDYEVVAAVPGDAVVRLAVEAAAAGIALTTIGRIAAGGEEAVFRDASGEILRFARPSFSHF